MRQSVRSLRDRFEGPSALVGELVRRMRLVATAAVVWTIEGLIDDDGSAESDEAEVFPGIGFYARPKATDATEVILLKVGGASGHGVIVATRNQDGIKRIGAFGADETIVFNSTTAIKIGADGSIQIGAIGGPFVPLDNGVVLASGIDPFTGATYGALGSASTKVMAEK
jgi:hypothetical protein